MYLPEAFRLNDPEWLHGLVRSAPLGTLVTMSPEGLQADHLPFELTVDGEGAVRLAAHVARANPVWREADTAIDSLVVFHGPSAYVSPSLYETKHLNHEAVPTYNYAVVHAHGRLVVHDDARWVEGLVGRLTRRFESRRDESWKMSDAPRPYLDKQLANIVGIELLVTRLVGKWKMSQNRTPADRARVMQGLDDGDAAGRDVADVMARLR